MLQSRSCCKGTPKAAIARNIVSVVKRAAPWLNPPQATASQLGKMRFELRMVEEYLAGRRVAAAYRVRVLGFDETTKNQEPSLTSNVQIQDHEGGPIIDVILRGAYTPPGATSELIAKAIDEKCFERLRKIMVEVEEMFRKLYPEEKWTGPDPTRLGLHRLGGGGGLMSDTCTPARKTKRCLQERIAACVKEAAGDDWMTLSEAEQAACVRTHVISCMNHVRNIFLAEMSRAQAAHAQAELQGHLDAFASWERMSTDFDQFLRAVYKEFHEGGRYYKGKGKEMLQWMRDTHPSACYLHVERAEGGRQDLDFDAAAPIYMNWLFLVEFLHRFVHLSDHANQLEDFLYSVLRSVEFCAMARANALVSLLISQPLRWLAGKASELHDWSPAKATWAYDLVEQTLECVALDGSVLINAQLDIFKPIADEQPLFRDYRKFTYSRAHILSPDRNTTHLLWKATRAELLSPTDPTRQATLTKTIQYLEVQAAAALRKFHDEKLVIASMLSSKNGTGCLANTAQMHEDLRGCTNVNDGLAERVFGVFDHKLILNPGISQAAASALTQACIMKSFSHGDCIQHRKGKKGDAQTVERSEGYFYKLPKKEQMAIVEYARVSLVEMRKLDANDAAEHTAYIKAKRKSELEEELEKVIKGYALAITFFKRWQKAAVRSIGELVSKLRTTFDEPDAKKLNQLKLNWLREQIDMRVIGLSWTEFKTNWSSSADAHVGSVEQLTGHLKEIIETEIERNQAGELPKAACAPIMNRKAFKPLGALTKQAAELTSPFVELSGEQLLARVHARRDQLQAAGEIDDLEDEQPLQAPPLSSLIGWKIEVRWRYWRATTDEERAQRKAQKRAEYIWAEGEVVAVAAAESVPVHPKIKDLDGETAVKIKWPEDADFEEKEQCIWTVLKPKDFSQQVHLGWRYAAESIARLARERTAARMP